MSSVGSSNTPLRSAPASLSTEQWVHLLPVGHVQGRDGRGPYIIDDPDAVILRTQERAGNTQLPIDYEHQTIVTAKNGQPAPAAGWIKGLQARADGIWGLAAWTDRASVDPAPVWPDTQAVADWALMNSRGERILRPE